jgi:hypothetical protein
MSAPPGPVDHGPVYNGMPATALIGVTWHKSRCSSPQGECVAAADADAYAGDGDGDGESGDNQ